MRIRSVCGFQATISILNPGSGFVKSWLLGFPKNRSDRRGFEKKTTSRGRPGFFFEAGLCPAWRFRFRPVGENPGSQEPRKNQAAARSRRRAAWRSEFLRGEEGQETIWAFERFSVSASGRVYRARQATTKPRERPTRAARPDEAKPRRPASRGHPRAIGSAGLVFSFFRFLVLRRKKRKRGRSDNKTPQGAF